MRSSSGFRDEEECLQVGQENLYRIRYQDLYRPHCPFG